MSDKSPLLSNYDNERLQNLSAFEKLKPELCSNYMGLYVGIAFGRLICVEQTFEQAMTEVDSTAPHAVHRIVIRVGDTLHDSQDEIGPAELFTINKGEEG